MTALIETMRVQGGRAPLWYLHVRRLSESCLALGVPLPRKLDIPDGADRVLRWEVSARGVDATERALPIPAPLRLVSSRVVHRPYPHKTTDRAFLDQARAAAMRQGADDALLRTAGGDVAECGTWSLFWWEDDGLRAPPLALGVLRSVSRLRIEELLGGPVPAPAHAHASGELGVPAYIAANAVRGIVPVASLDGVPVRQDARTEGLARAFWP